MISYAKTDTGIVRRSNQDFLFASDQPVGPLPNLFIVADGMGGHKAGDFASRYVVCLLYTSPSPRDISGSRMPSSA